MSTPLRQGSRHAPVTINHVFDWKVLRDIRPALLRNAVGTMGYHITHDHLQELKDLGDELGASAFAYRNSAILASGYDDLVVVLREPTDDADRVCYLGHPMKDSCRTLGLLDETLELAFAGQRNVENTIILDRRLFRSNIIRASEDLETRKRNDQTAYRGFEAVLAKLRPKVVVVCQCRPPIPDRQQADQWKSSTKRAGEYDIVCLPNGHECFRVYSYHPMYFQRIDASKRPLRRVLAEYMFDATFVLAANLLAGQELSGSGLLNLRVSAMYGPKVLLSSAYRNGYAFSYQWTTGKDCTSKEVLEKLWALGVFKKNDPRIKTMLAEYRTDALVAQMDALRIGGHDLILKRDVLPEFWYLIEEQRKALIFW
ncbi:hypothetical protein M011DRAFT_458162 [Sporormia fimetaria CBS 119925]|uniref:Uncharacterized protein n=1 Tax=Sporormia fimetaria CBS 119925 TaxID=1340428 RepID=A0A6A6VAV2_9PLEO|nr:hypothetical protein M011DRAFT_458162 [Sporormia fimetaria CBS 119925]